MKVQILYIGSNYLMKLKTVMQYRFYLGISWNVNDLHAIEQRRRYRVQGIGSSNKQYLKEQEVILHNETKNQKEPLLLSTRTTHTVYVSICLTIGLTTDNHIRTFHYTDNISHKNFLLSKYFVINCEYSSSSSNVFKTPTTTLRPRCQVTEC